MIEPGMEGNTTLLLSLIEPLWWLAFFCALGLCIGSFLNAVIHRLPRNISLKDPLWSFCPACNHRLRWYDNLPLIGFIRLKGRCRDCAALISPRYPLVEVLGAVVILLVFDALAVAQTHEGLSEAWGISWRLSQDWPIVLAHLVLFSCLFGMAAVDLENYWVDIRFTNVAVIFGFIMHAVWTPPSSDSWPRPGPTTAAATVSMTAALLLTVWILRRFFFRTQDDDMQAAIDAESARQAPRTLHALDYQVTVEDLNRVEAVSDHQAMRIRWLGMGLTAIAGVVLLGLIVYALAATRMIDPNQASQAPLRWIPALVLLFLLIVGSLAQERESDSEISEAITEEAPSARKFAAIELAILLPTIIVGVVIGGWLMYDDAAHTAAAKLLNWRPVGEWRPLLGISTAAMGFIIGGAVGWLVRIPATLLLGKEAFGVGDIHILAAAGCVAGWPVAVIGFVFCSFLALGGWLLSLPLKRSRIIALVPWLAMGMLVVTLYYNPIVKSQPVQNITYVFDELVRRLATKSVQ